jgi:hypothetical protein
MGSYPCVAQPALEDCLLEHALDVHRTLGQAERAMRDQARSIVQKRDQIRLARSALQQHSGPMHDIAVPDLPGAFGQEAAALFGLTVGADRTG